VKKIFSLEFGTNVSFYDFMYHIVQVFIYCIVSIQLYSTSCSAHQSEVLPLTYPDSAEQLCEELVQGPYTLQ